MTGLYWKDMRALGIGLLLLFLTASAGAQIDPSTALLGKAGWDALAAGQSRVAAEAFRSALAADPRNARLCLGAAIAAFLERRDADAKELADRAVALDPKLTDARVLLGQVLYRLGDIGGAIRTYETLAGESQQTEAVATLERWRRERDLHERMQQEVGAHFVVSFEGPAEEAIAAQALASLDRAYWRVGGVLGTLPTDPIPVVLYTREQFRDITRSPAWAAGAYDGTIRVPVRDVLDDLAARDELERVLAHEFTHAVIRGLSKGNVPTWLNEGLATTLERDDLSWADERVRESGGRIPLAELQNGFGRLSAAQAPLAYATSAIAVRRLLDHAGGVAVANLLRDLGDRVPLEAAFLRRMQRNFADFLSSPERF